MSAFAALVLKNQANTDVTFNPSSIESGLASWHVPNSIYDARQRATFSVRLPKNGSNVARITAKLVFPIMDTVDATKKVAEASAEVVFLLPKQASETQRLDLRKGIDSFITNAVATAAVQYLEGVY